MIARLEQIGYDSLAELAQAAPGDIVRQVAAMLGATCWRNSPQARAAIAAIDVARAQPPPKTSPKKSSSRR